MTLTLHLPPDTEEALAEAAEQQGTTPEQAAEQALRERFTPKSKPLPQWATPLTRPPYDPAKALATLDSFDDGDAEEQRETLSVLMESIDRDRPGQRRIFGEGINPMPPLDEIG